MAKLSAKARYALPVVELAFPAQHKKPLQNASHVRNVIARFNQATGVSELEKNLAWRRFFDFAKRYGAQVHDTSWRELDKPQR